jgi:hypothetical protein
LLFSLYINLVEANKIFSLFLRWVGTLWNCHTDLAHMKDLEDKKGATDPPDPVAGLNFNSSNIINLAPSICTYTQITSLILSNNLLSRLPAEIGKLVNLQRLDISKNRISELPRGMGYFHMVIFQQIKRLKHIVKDI